LNNPKHPQYDLFQEKFPKYWAEAGVLSERGLIVVDDIAISAG